MQLWKDVVNYEGLYQVSNDGQVRSLDKKIYTTNQYGGRYEAIKKGKVLKPEITNCGYERVALVKNGTKKHFSVHRLVAEAFIPNPDNLSCVNHKDENKLNNNVNNLEWCTYKYNNNYGTSIERSSKKRYKPVVAIKNDLTLYFNSLKQCAKVLKINRKNISVVCRGKQNTIGGYKIQYLEVV